MTEGWGGSRCPETGLAVPECSCQRCLERMLHSFRPELLAGEMRVTRLRPRAPRRPGAEHRRAA